MMRDAVEETIAAFKNRAFSSDKGSYRGKDTNRYERCERNASNICQYNGNEIGRTFLPSTDVNGGF